MKTGIIAVVIVAILGVGGFALTRHTSKSPTSDTSSNTNQPAKSSAAANSDTSSGSGSSTPATGTDFTINANDESADVEKVNVKKGDTIHITFNVNEDGTYHGGLEFKSDVVSSQPIKPGASDTVSFTADKSFNFTPFWYQSNVQKGYLIAVNVQ